MHNLPGSLENVLNTGFSEGLMGATRCKIETCVNDQVHLAGINWKTQGWAATVKIFQSDPINVI